MKVVSASQMRSIDERGQTEYGISADALMAQAGASVAFVVLDRFSPRRVCVVCGKGNNAGDGFVIACELAQAGIAVDAVCLAAEQDLRGPAANAHERMRTAGIRARGAAALSDCLAQADVVVDAILGTGVRGAVTGAFADAIATVNRCGKPVVAVDIPSGVREFASGEETGPVIHASLTVTIGLPKTSIVTMPGWQFTGSEIVVEPIGFPPALLSDESICLNMASARELASWLPVRPPDSHKGTFGTVGIVAGSADYAGAAVLVARGALRAGCGLACIFTPPALNGIYKVALPEAVSRAAPGTAPDCLDGASADAILAAAAKMDVLVVGPGLGTAKGQVELVGRLLSEWKGTMVLDADGLTCVALLAADGNASADALLSRRDGATILTPHPGEMSRIARLPREEIQSNRIDTAASFAARSASVVLLKGACTVVARPDGQVYANPGASSALAKGGSGDVLAGVIGALAAQGMPPWQSAVAGAHIHYRAAVERAAQIGDHGVLASEVADKVAPVLRDLAAMRG